MASPDKDLHIEALEHLLKTQRVSQDVLADKLKRLELSQELVLETLFKQCGNSTKSAQDCLIDVQKHNQKFRNLSINTVAAHLFVTYGYKD